MAISKLLKLKIFFEVEYRDSRDININNRVSKVANIKHRKNSTLLSYKKIFYDNYC